MGLRDQWRNATTLQNSFKNLQLGYNVKCNIWLLLD